MIKINPGLSLFFKEVGKHCLLSQEEEHELGMRAIAGDRESRNKLVESNIRLVAFIAKRYVDCGIEYEDLVDEGILGLMRAVQKFDATRGDKFSTHAAWWIRQSITGAIYGKTSLIRLPRNVAIDIICLKKLRSKLTVELNCEPTIEEIADRANMSTTDVRKLLRLDKATVSLNQPVYQTRSGKKNELGDILPDEEQDLDLVISKAELKANILKIIASIKTLTQQEIDVIFKRSGVFDGKIWTYEKIGDGYKVTRERIRQIEKDAISKIRKSPQAYELAAYFEDPDAAYKILSSIKKNNERADLNKKMLHLLRLAGINNLNMQVFAIKMGYAGKETMTDAEIAESFFISEEKVQKIYEYVLKAIKFSKYREQIVGEDPRLEELLNSLETSKKVK